MTRPEQVSAHVSILSNHALEGVLCTNYSFPSTIRCHLFRRGMHDTYIVINGTRQYYFKTYYPGLRTLEQLEAELALLHHLKDDGIRVVEPVQSRNSSYILELHASEGVRLGVLFHAVEGKEVESTDLDVKKFGAYIAAMHQSLDKITSPINRWHLDCASFLDQSMAYVMQYSHLHKFDYDFLWEVAAKTRHAIETLLTKTMPAYGLCHGDIYSGNLRVDSSGNPVLFDFDLCGYGWRAYDISIFICRFGSGIDTDAMERRERRKEAFLDGYFTVRCLSEAELQTIYIFAPFRRLFNIGHLYARFAESWGHDLLYKSVQEETKLLKNWIHAYPIA